ncbi:MAG: internalin, putative [uncultured Aureispira sp.]|uniref:Internalin, putative n=1 Tax=uncultured Aureispira sp. TaxID=1331704 RepID=A0A6S6UM62_9BACT|nr:MAG: internalin, putative [uncultured Aureispira sp.]
MNLLYLRNQFTIGFILLFCSLALESNASHNMGADLSYVCTGGNNYIFTLAFYRDCAGISAPNTVNLSLSSASGCGTNQSVSMIQQSVAEASPLCAAQLPNSTCNGGTLQGVEVYTYTASVTLSGPCTDWVASFSDCCRNGAITNSSSGSIYVETLINNVAAPCNSSPVFATPPIPYICNNQPFGYNHGTTDPDGDSLVFSLITPKESPSLNITHNAGFSATQPLSTTGAYAFDPATGQMNFTPNTTQIGVVAILVEEYRNGVLIGTTMRDMEIVVIACTNNTPIPSAVQNLSGGALNNSAFETCIGNTLSFDITCSDQDAADVVTVVNTVAANLPGATVTVVNGNPASINVSWFVSSITNQTFIINFNDGSCPVAGQQTLGFIIKPVTVSFPAQGTIKCPDVTTKQLQALAGSGTYIWSPSTNLSDPNISNPIATIPSTPATFSVTYTDPLGCIATNSITITDHAMDLVFTPDTSQLQFCTGDAPINLVAALNGDVPIPIAGGYTTGTTTFAPIPIPGGTTVSLSDDALSAAQPIGFSFNFWGTNYTDFFISSNGFISFTAGSSNGCCSGQSLPSTSTPNNLIAFSWDDLDPGNGGQPAVNLIRHQTVGIAPNRILVMEFFNVNHYPSGNNVTSQVHLIEATGCIEIHTTTQPDGSGGHTMGIEDAGGNNAVVVAGRNRAAWTATNEGITFCPIPTGFSSNYSYSWSPSLGLSSTNTATTSASPALTTTYTCTSDDGICATQRNIQIGCTLLPVKCERFSALQQNNSIQLEWTTLSEDNNLGFSIERSTDGILFEEIAWADGRGTTNVSQRYTYHDAAVANGLSYYYRLKQVDVSYSSELVCDIAHVQMTGTFVNHIHLQPNPTKGNTRLRFHSKQLNSVEIKITDVVGRTLINMGTHEILQGHNSIEIPLNTFTTGIYYIELKNEKEGFRTLKKAIKQ